MLDPLAQPERLPDVARRLERLERLAIGQPAAAATRTISASSSPLVMQTPLTIPSDEVREVQVVATMVGGRWVHNPPPWD